MGIHFLYIGRDEATLKDKLLVEVTSDEFPKEMNITGGIAALRPPLPYPPPPGMPVSNASAPLSFESLLDMFGQPRNTNFSIYFPTVPPTFNASHPFVEEPFAPNPPPEVDLSKYMPGLPKGPFNITNPVYFNMVESLLKTFVPVLPKDFNLSSVITSGGIVTSEIESIVDQVLTTLGIPKQKDPFEAFSGGHRRSVETRAKQRELNKIFEPLLGLSLRRLRYFN